jgi:hypothetical protein
MSFMSCSAVSSNGITLRLLVEERIRRRGVCACEVLALGSQRRRMRRPVVFAKKRRRPKKWQRPWWKTFFSDWSDDDGSLSSWRKDDELFEEIGSYNEIMENEKFETWKRKAEAIVELTEAQQDAVNAEERSWEDWITGASTSGGSDWGGDGSVMDQITDNPAEIVKDKSFIETFRDSTDEDYEDMLFEDRVFIYASTNSVRSLLPCLCHQVFFFSNRVTKYYSFLSKDRKIMMHCYVILLIFTTINWDFTYDVAVMH